MDDTRNHDAGGPRAAAHTGGGDGRVHGGMSGELARYMSAPLWQRAAYPLGTAAAALVLWLLCWAVL